MMSKKSWVNKSLIRSDLKRFKWGSIIYFIVLFLSTNLVFLTQMPFNTRYEHIDEWFDIMSTFNTTFLIGVSAVVGVLVLRRQSAKKQLFFERALPVKERTAVSGHILSGLILMIAPILIDSVIMILVMLLDTTGEMQFGYIAIFFLKSCLSVLVLFSFVCISNILTGNPFAGIVLNGIIHVLPYMIVTTVESFGTRFVNGFPSWDSATSMFIMRNVPLSKLYSLVAESFSVITDGKCIPGIIYLIVVALILYALSIILSTKRKAEDVETMVCFKHLAPVLKYLLTILIASLEMITLYSMDFGNVFTAVFMIVTSALVFFGIEMLQRKSVNVLNTIPGFALLVMAFVGVVVFTANTSFFGYKTRIPKKEDIAKASIIETWADRDVNASDSDYIDFILERHNKYITEGKETKNYRGIEIRYIFIMVHKNPYEYMC